jgi:predicted acyltransferase (DUF342 family)
MPIIKKILTPTSVSLITAALLLTSALLLFSNTAVGNDRDNNSDIADLTSSLEADIFTDSTVFAKSYVTLGSDANIAGNVIAGEATTVGANADVHGTIDSGAATTLGAGVWVLRGDVYSGAATTLGANSVIQGDVESQADTTVGSGAVVYKYNLGSFMDLDLSDTSSWDVQVPGSNWGNRLYSEDHVGQLESVQDYLYHLAPSITNVIPTPNMFSGVSHNIDADETWLPGVYTIDGSLSVSADVTITLDNTTTGDFIINVRDYVSFGALAKVVWKEANDNNSRVIWNVKDAYISLGAEADIEGLLLANAYISTGEKSKVRGGAYSATSYVVVGAEAKIGTITTQTETGQSDPPPFPGGGGQPPAGPMSQ